MDEVKWKEVMKMKSLKMINEIVLKRRNDNRLGRDRRDNTQKLISTYNIHENLKKIGTKQFREQ